MKWQRMMVPAALLWLAACGDSPVDPDPQPVARLVVTPARIEIFVGGSDQIGAYALDAKGRRVNDQVMTWTSTRPEVVTVTEGTVTGVSEGAAAVVVGCAHLSVEVPVAVVSANGTGKTWYVEVGYGDYGNLSEVWGSAPTDVYAVGQQATLFHFDGVQWDRVTIPGWYEVTAMWSSSPRDVFALSKERIAHFDGIAWTEVAEADRPLRAIWGASSRDVFAAGSGLVLHYDGDSWTTMGVPPLPGLKEPRIESIWGSSSSDVFAVGGAEILHYDGVAWTAMDSPGAGGLLDVWGTAGDDVYAVGTHGRILHYDGNAWSVLASPTDMTLHGVGGTSASDVFAVGGMDGFGCCGVLLHFNGAWWTDWIQAGAASIVQGGLGQYWYGGTLRSIWGVDGHIFAAGTGPTILHSRP